MKLGSGRAPVQKMLDAGLLVAIGTDSTASNNDLDMLEETRLAAFLAKVYESPKALPAPLCLEMATARGAEVWASPTSAASPPAARRTLSW